MWKFRVSEKLPFWTRENANKPSKIIFDKWINENMKEVEGISINFVSFLNININTPFNGYKYIEIKNSENEEDTRYYFITAIGQTGSTDSYKYNGIIDVYASYTMDFITQNKDKEFVFLRKHEYEKTALQIEDVNISSIPKLYKNFYFEKSLFNHNESENIWYGQNLGIKGNDLMNGNKYYVFQDGVNGGYKFFPILSKTNDVTIYSSSPKKGAKKSEFTFWNGRKNGTLKQEILAEVNEAVVNAYNNGDIVEYQYRQVSEGYRFPAATVWFRDWQPIENAPYGTLPIDIYANTWYGNTAGAGLRGINYEIFVLGNSIYRKTSRNLTSSAFGAMSNVTDQGRMFKVVIYKGIPEKKEEIVKNSQTSLEIYRKKEENINKFLGIFYLPHFLNFKKYDKEEEYAFINIDPKGDNIDFFEIYKYSLSTITDKVNNKSYSTPYLLKYLNIKYYGNNINAEYRTNENSKIYIGGKLFFTDSASIISKSDDLIDLNRSIITYPYQLPIGVDTYEQYVKANRNVTDTGFSIAKQNQELQFAKSMVGGVMSFGTGAAQAVAGAVTGDIGSAVKGAMSAVNAPIDLTFDIIGQTNAINQMERKIRAQYEQANMTMGNQVQFSTIETASLTHYYDSEDGSQFEGVEISDLDESSLIQINNYIFLNGYLNPDLDTLENRLKQERQFNFIQIEAQIISSTLNLKYNQKWNNEIFSMILEQLTTGIRIWNIENIDDVEEWDDNAEWPNQPDRDDILPPQPPIRLPKKMVIKPDMSISSGTYLWLRAIGYNGFITFYNDILKIRLVNSYSSTSIEGSSFIKEQTFSFEIPSDITDLEIDLSKIDRYAVYSTSSPSNGWVATDKTTDPNNTINFTFDKFKNSNALSQFQSIKSSFRNNKKFTTSDTTNQLNLIDVNIIEEVGQNDNRRKN